MRGGDLARLALQPVAEHDAFVARRAGALGGGAQGVGRPRQDPIVRAGEDLIARLRRLVGRVGERAGHAVGRSSR